MNSSLQTWEADFQLTAFGTILHFRQISDVLVEKCLLPGWQLDRPDRNPHAILEWDARFDGTGSLRLLVDGQTAADAWVTAGKSARLTGPESPPGHRGIQSPGRFPARRRDRVERRRNFDSRALSCGKIDFDKVVDRRRRAILFG